MKGEYWWGKVGKTKKETIVEVEFNLNSKS